MLAPWVRGSERDFTRGRQATWPPLIAPRAQQGEGAARLRAAPARARRGRLSIKKNAHDRHTFIHLGCRLHMHDIQWHMLLN